MPEQMNKQEKVLVCITAQSNSKRLILKGAEVCGAHDGELHILHVQKGHNIFENQDTPRLLQELFEYGGALGGMVHAYCDDDVPESIGKFIEKEEITRVVLGAPPAHLTPEQAKNGGELFRIIGALPKPVEVIILDRED